MLGRLVVKEPDNPLILQDYGWYLGTQDLKRARALIERAVLLDPRQARSQYRLAVVLAESGEVEGAREHARAALKLRPSHEEAARLLAELEGGPGARTDADNR